MNSDVPMPNLDTQILHHVALLCIEFRIFLLPIFLSVLVIFVNVRIL
jgi:hypothetical protein